MARIYQALEILGADGNGTGKYRFTVHSDEESWPAHAVGYCAEDCSAGHSTKEGAELHWKQFRFDQRLRVGLESKEEKKKCQVCEEWTNGRAWIDDEFFKEFVLCEKHNNAEAVRGLWFTDEECEQIRRIVEGGE